MDFLSHKAQGDIILNKIKFGRFAGIKTSSFGAIEPQYSGLIRQISLQRLCLASFVMFFFVK